ncbi:ATP-binding protein [Nitrosococcus wardiae]|uniref:ATP-binding protein n=1 Tax=Nitrosococcus wardiae TaxID=1814290 RepID=A0A4P7BY52_9GAMM|nr:ATP-binding protein [Nitrosococcus wardiae]QBQ54159.1 ATP-binding protein [Nitrosococcus wardiae]
MCNGDIQLDIVVPNKTCYLGFIGEIGEKVAEELDRYSGDRKALAYHLNLALTEALVNAMEHGNTGDSEQTVHVTIQVLPDQLCIKVYDHGQGFDLDRVKAPNLEHPGERGRGIFLIKSIMDSVSYHKINGGNVLEMRKRLA